RPGDPVLGGPAGLVVAELHVEGDLQAFHPVVGEFLTAGPDPEPGRLGPFGGQEIHVDRRAPGDRGEQQLHRGEVVGAAVAGDELSSPHVAGAVAATLGPVEVHGTVGVCRHDAILAHATAHGCPGRHSERREVPGNPSGWCYWGWWCTMGAVVPVG